MSFVTDKAELKPGLVVFRRGDVEHRMWYCRVKITKVDRHKTISLKTTDVEVARQRAFDQDADIRFRLKHDVSVFNRPFREVRAVIEGALDSYVGSTQARLIGAELWGSYPAWL